jgi:hypothetical protein
LTADSVLSNLKQHNLQNLFSKFITANVNTNG